MRLLEDSPTIFLFVPPLMPMSASTRSAKTTSSIKSIEELDLQIGLTGQSPVAPSKFPDLQRTTLLFHFGTISSWSSLEQCLKRPPPTGIGIWISTRTSTGTFRHTRHRSLFRATQMNIRAGSVHRLVLRQIHHLHKRSSRTTDSCASASIRVAALCFSILYTVAQTRFGWLHSLYLPLV